MISRGLLISVGVTLLAVGLLFVYFRNKVSGIEKKVELMFNLIQNYEGQQNAMQAQQYIPASSQESMQSGEMPQMRSELIEISDDEAEDSEEVSDSEEDEDEEDEETLKFEPTTIELTETDVKTIDLNTNIEQETKDQESGDSLDEIDSDEDDNDDGEEPELLEAEEVITLTENDYKKKTVAELKQLASDRGLQNYRSLKKAPLIELLMSQ